jgi:hypothetical protein
MAIQEDFARQKHPQTCEDLAAFHFEIYAFKRSAQVTSIVRDLAGNMQREYGAVHHHHIAFGCKLSGRSNVSQGPFPRPWRVHSRRALPL